MQAGKLRHRITLQAASTAKDGYGEDIQTFGTLATVWASIEPLRGRELLLAQQISAEITFRIRIRYNASLAAEDRVIFGSRTFEIIAVLNKDERDEQIELMAKEVL